jgi:hypothetical protein
MLIGVKLQLAVVTVDSDIVGDLGKMPHIFTNGEYADMLYVYGFCNGSVIAVTEEYRRRLPLSRIPDCRVFSMVFNTFREGGTLPSAHVSSERPRQQHMEEQENIVEMVQRSPTTSMRQQHMEEQENIVEMVQRSPTTSMRKLSTRLGDSRTRVWQTLHDDGL